MPPISALSDDASDSASEEVNLADLADPYGPYGRFARYIKPDEPCVAPSAKSRTKSEARVPPQHRAVPEDDDTSDSDVPVVVRRPPVLLELDEDSGDEDGFYETKYSKMLRECRPAVRQGPRRPRADSSDDDDDDLCFSGRSPANGRRHSDGVALRRREADGLTPTLSGLDLGGLEDANGLHGKEGRTARGQRARRPVSKPALSDSDDDVHPDLEKYRPSAATRPRPTPQADAEAAVEKGSASSWSSRPSKGVARGSNNGAAFDARARETSVASSASVAGTASTWSRRNRDDAADVTPTAYPGRRRPSGAASLADTVDTESTVSSSRRHSAAWRSTEGGKSVSSAESVRPDRSQGRRAREADGSLSTGSGKQSWFSSSDATLDAKAEAKTAGSYSSRTSRSSAWPSDSGSRAAQDAQSGSSRGHRPPGEDADGAAPKYAYRTRRPTRQQQDAQTDQCRSRPTTPPEGGRRRTAAVKPSPADAEAEVLDGLDRPHPCSHRRDPRPGVTPNYIGPLRRPDSNNLPTQFFAVKVLGLFLPSPFLFCCVLCSRWFFSLQAP